MDKDNYRLLMVKDDSTGLKKSSLGAFARYYKMNEKKRLITEITGLISKIIEQKSR